MQPNLLFHIITSHLIYTADQKLVSLWDVTLGWSQFRLCMVSSPSLKDGGIFEKFKSLGGGRGGERVFFHHMGVGGNSIWGDSDIGNHNSGQNNCHTITFFFQRKNSFHFYISFNFSFWTVVLLTLKEWLAPMKSCAMNNQKFLIFMFLSIMIS